MTIDLAELNTSQREAVSNTEGPVLVVAGAGSGKTKVITYRIMHLMEKGTAPYQILAVTFTNKAAGEMRHRIEDRLGPEASDLTITTFHAFCARFLRREMSYLGRDTQFAIYDTQDQRTCLKRVIRSMDLSEKNYPVAMLAGRFSKIKNSGDLSLKPKNQIEADIMDAYQEELEQQNAVDFDDLLVLTCRILEEFPEVRERYQNRFAYIMVDEYQDTNQIQARLIDLLLAPHRNLCVVGDEDQSIYGWRGADIKNILQFEEKYPGAQIFKLEQNYRSTQIILDFANDAIGRNRQRKPKKLWTALEGGDPIVIRDNSSAAEEAEFLVQSVQSLASSEGMDYSEFAVLFRSNYLSRVLEEMFRRYRVPYQLIGGLKFYDRKEIKDLLAYMRIVVNPKDWTSFARAVSVPTRGIGQKSQDVLYRLFQKMGDIPSALDEAVAHKLISTRGLNALKEFRKLYNKLRESAEGMRPSQWLASLMEEIDYLAYLERVDEVGADSRVANVNELLSAMEDLERQGVQTLAQFMDFSALTSDQDELDDGEPKVNLMTIHAAKGLEFDTVFVVGLEDGVFPNQRALDEDKRGLEEERRLFYVAVTRAKRRLYLTYARRRQTFGSVISNPKSRFLTLEDEQPKEKPKTSVQFGTLVQQTKRMNQVLQKKHGLSADFSRVTGLGDETGAGKASFKAGDVVRHAAFGTGTIQSIRGRGDDEKAAIYFPGKGVRTLLVAKANLQKIG